MVGPMRDGGAGSAGLLENPTQILFATAEYAPYVKVGGLSEASSGLVGCLRSMGTEVDVVMPDYGLIELDDVEERQLDGMPSWAPPVTIRRGWTSLAEPLTLIDFEGRKIFEPLAQQPRQRARARPDLYHVPARRRAHRRHDLPRRVRIPQKILAERFLRANHRR